MLPIVGDLITSVVGAGRDLFKSYFPPDLTPEQRAKLEAGLRKYQIEMTSQMNSYSKTVMESQASIIKAEANGDSWLQKSWRPITMLVFVFIVANNYILFPYLSLFFEQAPKLDIPKDMWDLLKLGLGGYVVGRSLEKGIKNYAEGKK